MSMSRPCPSLKSLSYRFGGILRCCNSTNKYEKLDSELERKMMEAKQKNVDSNGTIDREELKQCLQKLQFDSTEQEVNDLFESCDLGRNKGMKFKEFIVVLCLIYLLAGTSTSNHPATAIGSPELQATFDSIIEAFLFLDKNGDGKLDKKDMIKSMNDDFPQEKAPTHITMNRFKELDWNRDGKVGFREFIFSLINWVGLDCNDEVHVTPI